MCVSRCGWVGGGGLRWSCGGMAGSDRWILDLILCINIQILDYSLTECWVFSSKQPRALWTCFLQPIFKNHSLFMSFKLYSGHNISLFSFAHIIPNSAATLIICLKNEDSQISTFLKYILFFYQCFYYPGHAFYKEKPLYWNKNTTPMLLCQIGDACQHWDKFNNWL